MAIHKSCNLVQLNEIFLFKQKNGVDLSMYLQQSEDLPAVCNPKTWVEAVEDTIQSRLGMASWSVSAYLCLVEPPISRTHDDPSLSAC